MVLSLLLSHCNQVYKPKINKPLNRYISQWKSNIKSVKKKTKKIFVLDLNGRQISSPHQFLSPMSQESSPTNEHQLQQQQSHQTTPNFSNHNNSFNNGSNLDDETGPPWTCRSCTFQNHALLQKCETCDTVRVLPGTIRITSSSSNEGGSASSAALASFLTNNDTPPFALHTWVWDLIDSFSN